MLLPTAVRVCEPESDAVESLPGGCRVRRSPNRRRAVLLREELLSGGALSPRTSLRTSCRRRAGVGGQRSGSCRRRAGVGCARVLRDLRVPSPTSLSEETPPGPRPPPAPARRARRSSARAREERGQHQQTSGGGEQAGTLRRLDARHLPTRRDPTGEVPPFAFTFNDAGCQSDLRVPDRVPVRARSGDARRGAGRRSAHPVPDGSARPGPRRHHTPWRPLGNRLSQGGRRGTQRGRRPVALGLHRAPSPRSAVSESLLRRRWEPSSRMPTRSLRLDATHSARVSSSGSAKNPARGPGVARSVTGPPGGSGTGATSTSGNVAGSGPTGSTAPSASCGGPSPRGCPYCAIPGPAVRRCRRGRPGRCAVRSVAPRAGAPAAAAGRPVRGGLPVTRRRQPARVHP